MDDDIFSIDESDFLPVTTPAGATFTVMNEDERDYYEGIAARYQSDNIFKNVSDLQDLDRVLSMELMVQRWGLWLSRERDYWGNPVDIDALKKGVNDYSKELRLLKKALGIDKGTRDKDKGESFGQWVEDLRQRAKQFGVMRENQAVKAITLWQELKALITLHDNCTEEERRENKVSEKDIVAWVRAVIPEFDKIDEHFRTHQQKYWIREM